MGGKQGALWSRWKWLNRQDCNGGQKCWDLSSDISKTRDPFPTTPNKVEFWTKWVEKSAFFGQNIAGGTGGGGQGDEPKADQKIVIRSRALSNNYLEWLFHTSICICIFTVHKADTSVVLCRRPPACTVLGRLYKGMFALLVVILCSSENFLGAMNGYRLAMFRGNLGLFIHFLHISRFAGILYGSC